MGVKSLKDFIKSIRQCNTASEERAVIVKESALIRSSFADSSPSTRYKNISKLLYIHMLGYPAQFGQIECLKLVASSRFTDKRLGYLGIMLLMDEKQETLTLVTNSLKNDMNSHNMYIVGLALTTFGNLCSPEMAHDLFSEVEKHLTNTNVYIRKKACLCVVRVLRKAPDLLDSFSNKVRQLLTDKNYSSLVSSLQLITEMCQLGDSVKEEVRKNVGAFTRILSDLQSPSPNPEYDVNGIVDPFLQVIILRLLRILGKDDPACSDEIHSPLEQIFTKMDGSKNSGSAVLYEAILTAMEIESTARLRELAIQKLAVFLSSKDNNMKYVSLNLLLKIVKVDKYAVQIHQDMILDCLHDPDISIRRRALDLSFAIIDDRNIEIITPALLSYMNVAELEFISILVDNLISLSEKYAPNPKWYIDTIMKILKSEKVDSKDEIFSNFLRHLSLSTTDSQAYAAHSFFQALLHCLATMDSLIQCGAWIVGEYGHFLKIPGIYGGVTFLSILEDQVVTVLLRFLKDRRTLLSTRYFIISALLKLQSRYAGNMASEIQAVLEPYTKNRDLELQQRCMEYLYFLKNEDLRNTLFEPIPPLDLKQPITAPSSTVGSPKLGEKGPSSAADIMKDFGGLDIMDHREAGFASPLADRDSFGSPLDAHEVNDEDPLGVFASGSVAPASLKCIGTYLVYSRYGLDLSLKRFYDPTNPHIITLRAIFLNDQSEYTMRDILLQVAVPKHMDIFMNPPSTTVLEPHQECIQIITITTSDVLVQAARRQPQPVALKLRLKIQFMVDGDLVDDITEFVFPDDH